MAFTSVVYPRLSSSHTLFNLESVFCKVYFVNLNFKKISKNHQPLLEIKMRSMDIQEKGKTQSTGQTSKERVRLKHVDHSFIKF